MFTALLLYSLPSLPCPHYSTSIDTLSLSSPQLTPSQLIPCKSSHCAHCALVPSSNLTTLSSLRSCPILTVLSSLPSLSYPHCSLVVSTLHSHTILTALCSPPLNQRIQTALCSALLPPVESRIGRRCPVRLSRSQHTAPSIAPVRVEYLRISIQVRRPIGTSLWSHTPLTKRQKPLALLQCREVRAHQGHGEHSEHFEGVREHRDGNRDGNLGAPTAQVRQ